MRAALTAFSDVVSLSPPPWRRPTPQIRTHGPVMAADRMDATVQ